MPRFVVIGLGEDGRSKVVEIRDIAAGMSPRLPGVGWNCAWSTLHQPPEIPWPRRGQDDEWMDLELPAGATRWALFTFEAGLSTPLHHTATLDYDVILDGEVTLGLDEGNILLRAGDCVLIPAAMHSWQTDARSCTISVVYSGLEPPLPASR